MDFNFSNVHIPTTSSPVVHPVDLFHSLTVSDSSINDLWLAQGDALREWHDHRESSDVAITLNTGAGKTLIGLLIAQSLLNESHRQVVYACGSIQLVAQTADKARGYGLPVATYYRGDFENRIAYQKAEVPCITTYQALFNGRSRFTRDDVGALVFDDAHTAEHILRDQFTLRIKRATNSEIYDSVWTTFRSYHNDTGKASSYQETYEGVTDGLFLIPPHEVQRQASSIRQILGGANLTADAETMFAWEHIRDHEDLCCVLVTGDAVTFTPPVIPTSSLSFFAPSVRRVYLSATLTAPDAMVRAFGRAPSRIVSPSTTAGECERMILFPSATKEPDGDLVTAKQVIADQKALILVPSFPRGERWSDVSEMPRGDAATTAIEAFRDAPAPAKLTLASRYDGMDFAGETCRVMVIDDLPAGTGVLERFQWERLEMANTLNGIVASRIVQSFGRISRGMNDHGVVLITGRRLIDWLAVPRNRRLLPPFLEQQIALGETLCESITDSETLASVAHSCLDRSSGWLQLYSRSMGESTPRPEEAERELALSVALAEAEFGDRLWLREYPAAADALLAVLDNAFAFSHNAGGWASLWIGYAAQMAGDGATAEEYYSKAEATHRNIPRRQRHSESPNNELPEQVERIAQQMRVNYGGNSVSLPPKQHGSALAPLLGGHTPSKTEEALRALGQFLGLDSSRPDNEYGTGPDVLWHLEGHPPLCMEVKTDKTEASAYTKTDVGQLHSHVQWVKERTGVDEVMPIFVGLGLQFRPEASPSPEMRIIDLSRFRGLSDDLSALYDSVRTSLPLYVRRDLHRGAKEKGLMYSQILEDLVAGDE